MALTAKAWTAIILALVILSLTVAPTWPLAFLVLFGMIAPRVVAVAKNTSFLPLSRQAPALADHATALPDDAAVDGLASADDTAGGMRRKPEPSSISSSLSGFKYDVYLSFWGPDTGHGVAGHVYTQLADARIRVFTSNGECLVGKEIWPALEEAIKQSRIFIPILSRNYASSKSCLDELVQMWECMKLNGQTVLPIFYAVRPFHVRRQAGIFERYFNKHAKEFGSDTVETWREVLGQIATLTRYSWERNGSAESQLVKNFVACVVRVLNKDDQVVSDELVGIDHHVEEMMRKLGVAYSDGQATEVRGEEARVVGVCGERGVGKTTLANVVFNKTRRSFDAYSFLEGISSKGIQVSRRTLIADLQMSNLQMEKPAPFESSDEEIEEMASLYQNVKVLVVLDDVDEVEQIRALAGDLAWFGPGSRIIVTTEKKNVLNAFDRGAVEVHPVKPMDQRHAHKLFCKHAFKGYAAQDVSEYFGLSMDIAKAIGGLPSDILHQASSLRDDMNIDRWRTTLGLLRKKRKNSKAAFQFSYTGGSELEDPTEDNPLISPIQDSSIYQSPSFSYASKRSRFWPIQGAQRDPTGPMRGKKPCTYGP